MGSVHAAAARSTGVPPRKKPAAAKPAKKKAAKASAPAVRTKTAKPKREEPAPPAGKKPAAKPAAPRRPPVERTRIVFPKELYEARKEEVKAPLKERGLKWQYLGEGKGRYHADGVNLFAQFLDDGTHYSLWGDDKATVEALKDAWRKLLGDEGWAKATSRGEEATRKEKEEQLSEEIRIWLVGEPQRRPGEPELFYRKRREAWEARKPSPG